jgi:hypothetical protein
MQGNVVVQQVVSSIKHVTLPSSYVNEICQTTPHYFCKRNASILPALGLFWTLSRGLSLSTVATNFVVRLGNPCLCGVQVPGSLATEIYRKSTFSIYEFGDEI